MIGGFTNVKVEHTDAGGEFSLDNLNFFLIFDRFTRFRAVAELQFKDIFVADKNSAGTQDFAFDVRRLFGDFTVSDWLRLRVGTFLTPVGYWNLILAPPLTWTTEAPLIVEKTFFQPTTTGVMTLRLDRRSAPASSATPLFSQFLQPLAERSRSRSARLHRRLPAHLRHRARVVRRRHLSGGGDGRRHGRTWARSTCSGSTAAARSSPSSTSRTATRPTSAQWGTYLQGVVDVYGPFYLVGRYEHYDPAAAGSTLNLFTVGGVWKPFPFMAVKVDYRFVDRNIEDDDLEGFFSSFTTFF